MESMAILAQMPEPKSAHPARVVIQKEIRGDMPWAYFDGASSNKDKCGVGIVTHLNSNSRKEASVGLGVGTNNFAELKSLHLLLCWLI